MSVLADVKAKIKDNSLWLHPTWHFVSRVQFSSILAARNVCVDKMDYLIREDVLTEITTVTM